MAKISFLVISLVLGLAAGCAPPRPIIVQPPPGEAGPALGMEIIRSPSYRYTSYTSRFVLTVLNGLAHKIKVNLGSGEAVEIGPGSQAEIPFRKARYWRFIPLTVLVFDESGRVIATLAGQVEIPPNRRHYRGVAGDVWQITRARPLKQLD